ncbi:MAG: DUF177 domain-containing protein [Reichenbachiella sp.]
MKANRNYKIDIFGLKIGAHDFDFYFDKTLFESIEDRLIESGQGECKVTLIKKETMIELLFQISGKINLTCDRSNEQFDYPLELTEKLILKYGEAFDDSRDDIWVIPGVQQSINIEQVLYEFLSLAVPMKKLHPRFQDEDEDEEGLEFVYSSEEESLEEEKKEENDTDPRWDALKNIKNLN